MAEVIIAVLLFLVGAVCALIALIATGANHIGGATAPDQVDHWPAITFALVSLAAFGGGIWFIS